jgi:signal peptidase I
MNATRSFLQFVMDILETIVFVGSLFIVVYLYILQPNQVKGASMTHTFLDKDYIFTSKATYKLRAPKHGDVIVFYGPRKQGQDFDVEYIKRIIGLPGDTVMFTNCKVNLSEMIDCDVVLNGHLIAEPYLRDKTVLFHDTIYKENESITVPEDTFFVMGDNRPGSLDSRVFGPIPQSSVIGVVFYRYLPPSRMGWITSPEIYQ